MEKIVQSDGQTDKRVEGLLVIMVCQFGEDE